MRWLVGLIAALACAWSGAAHAIGVDNAEQVASYCSAEGGFGQRFGAESVSGRASGRAMNSTYVTPEAPYPPFGEVEVTFTHLSQRIHTVTASFELANEDAALVAFDDIREALSHHFQFAAGNEAGDGVVYSSVDSDAPGGYQVELSIFGNELILTCTDRALYQQTFDEITGRARIAERPEPPQLALPPEPAANVCQTPEARSAFIADFQTRLEAITAYGMESSRYAQTLTQWKTQQMIERGLWTEEDSQAFALSMMQDPQFERDLEANMAQAMSLLSAAMQWEAARDDATRCDVGVRALQAARATFIGAERQWRNMSDRYDAEARRRGGTLD